MEVKKNMERLDTILKLVKNEFLKATEKFGAFHNAHEGFAVLLEEVDELWDNVKLNQKSQNRNRLIREEAIQVAAMAIRIINDLGG
jgi:hypothetical protein